MEDPLMEVRTSLNATTNTGGLDEGSSYGGVEIRRRIDQMITDSINRGVDLKPLVKRRPLDQYAYRWNIRTDLGSSSKFTIHGDGGIGTPYPSTKTHLFAVALAYRTDYEVTGLMIAASASYYDSLADEAQTAIDELKLSEEKMMICGSVTGAYGISSAFLGLLELMRWHSTNGGDTEGVSNNKMQDTTSIYGTTRTSGTTELDVSYVIAGTIASATGVLELKHLDKAITQSNKKGGKDHERVFFCSEERTDEINQLLQPQQRFAGTLNLEGGFTIQTYKNKPIVGSRYMDKNGATNTTSWDKDTNADNTMYLLDLDEIEFRILAGTDAKHVVVTGEVGGSAGFNRADAQGGYFKTYGVFVVRAFNPQVHIANLTAPA